MTQATAVKPAPTDPMKIMETDVGAAQADITSLKADNVKTTGQEQQIEDKSYTDLQKNLSSIGDSFAKLQKESEDAFKPFAPPEPKDPLKDYGATMAGLMGIMSFFTGKSMIASMNAGASAMNAVRQGNSDDYQRSFEEWKTNSEVTQKKLSWENEQLSNILQLAQTDYNAAGQHIKNLSTIANDKALAYAWDSGGAELAGKLLQARENGQSQADSHRESLLRTIPLDMLNQQVEDYKKANNGKSPDSKTFMQMYQNAIMGGGMDQNTRDANAAELASGVPMSQVVSGYGKDSSQVRQLMRQDAVAYIMKNNPGMTPAQAGQVLAMNQISYASGKRSIGQLTLMLGATRQAVPQLEYNIKMATQEMNKLKSTNISPVLNAVLRGEQKWTGNPALSGLFMYLSATANEAGRIMSGGVGSVAQIHDSAREEVQSWIDKNMTPASWNEVAQGLINESHNRVENYQAAIEGQKSDILGQFPNAAATTQQQSAAGGTKDFSHLWGGK